MVAYIIDFITTIDYLSFKAEFNYSEILLSVTLLVFATQKKKTLAKTLLSQSTKVFENGFVIPNVHVPFSVINDLRNGK